MAKQVSSQTGVGTVRRRSWIMLIVAVLVTLVSYQLEHHGLWGKLVNYSKTPKLTLSKTSVTPNDLLLNLSRTAGPATYGSFVVQVTLRQPGASRALEVFGPHQLSRIPMTAIQNKYHFQQVTRGPWGLIVPLAAQARIRLTLGRKAHQRLIGVKTVIVTVQDVSGLSWTTTVPVS